MDLAYDHIQEDAYAKKEQPDAKDGSKPEESHSTLNDDFQEAYKAFSNSPWGAKLGGFFGNVVKQGGEVVTQAQKELAEVGEDATKGLTDLRASLISHTRNLSLTVPAVVAGSSKDAEDGGATPTATTGGDSMAEGSQESETVLSRLRAEAAKRLKDIQKAEDAADEALLRFGSNVRNYLRDAVSVSAPDANDQSGTVLFESKDAQGKRVIHASRFDAQLHVIHTTTESFNKDPSGSEYDLWTKEFDVDKKTPDINTDLQKYPDLRATMEKLVPDQIPYADFWKRYYFLRHGIETADARRRDLLKAASAEDDVKWDDDDSDEEADEEADEESDEEESDEDDSDEEESDDESDDKPAATPAPAPAPVPVPAKAKPAVVKTASAASSTTIHPPAKNLLKPAESRKSNDEKSQADSEASYDVVGATSGKTTQTPNSPKDSKKDEEDDSDDDSDADWE
ncbi:BSD domain protein [Ilyonectria destructans]|nr:BSD domain protein [Ilyonectria destructans]